MAQIRLFQLRKAPKCDFGPNDIVPTEKVPTVIGDLVPNGLAQTFFVPNELILLYAAPKLHLSMATMLVTSI